MVNKKQPLKKEGVRTTAGSTKSKRVEEAVSKGYERLIAVLDGLDCLVYVADFNSHELLFINQYGREIWGDILGRKCWESIQKDQKGPCSFCTNNRLVSGNGFPTGVHKWEFQNTITGKWYECRDQAIPWIGRGLVRMEIATDITERKYIEAALKHSEELYRSLFENMLNGFAYCRMIFEQNQPRDFIYLSVNSAFEKQTGLKDVSGKKVSEVIPGIYESDRQLIETYGRVALTGVPETFETHLAALDTWFSISVYSPEKEYFVAVFDVITERKQLEQKLIELATHDCLTGLPNRALLYDRFGIAMANAQRNKKRIAVMTLDLDLFKDVNDTMGHNVGDKVLMAVAGRLTSSLRKSDTVARMGGDEFVLLLWEVDDKDAAVIVAEKILEDFRQPFISDGHSLKVTVSIGIAIYPDNGENMEELLKCSDKLLYTAKQNGGDKFAI